MLPFVIPSTYIGIQDLKTINLPKINKADGLDPKDVGVLRRGETETWIKYFKMEIKPMFKFSL